MSSSRSCATNARGRTSQLGEGVQDRVVAAPGGVDGVDRGSRREHLAGRREHRRVTTVRAGSARPPPARAPSGRGPPGSRSPAPPHHGTRSCSASRGRRRSSPPTASRGTPRWRRPRGCRRRRTPTRRLPERSVTKVTTGTPGPDQPVDRRRDVRVVGGLEDDTVRPASAYLVQRGRGAAGSLSSPRWVRARTTAGRSDRSSASSARCEAVANRCGACITRSRISARPDSSTWARWRSSSSTARSTWVTVSSARRGARAARGRPWRGSGRPAQRCR